MWEISQGALTLKILTHASFRVKSLSITIGILAPYGINWRQQFHTNQIKPNPVTSNQIGKGTECRTNKSGAKPSIECEASILTTAPTLRPNSSISVLVMKGVAHCVYIMIAELIVSLTIIVSQQDSRLRWCFLHWHIANRQYCLTIKTSSILVDMSRSTILLHNCETYD